MDAAEKKQIFFCLLSIKIQLHSTLGIDLRFILKYRTTIVLFYVSTRQAAYTDVSCVCFVREKHLEARPACCDVNSERLCQRDKNNSFPTKQMLIVQC